MNENKRCAGEVIILVEDEQSLRHSISFTLLRHGYQVVTASTVDEAIVLVDDFVCQKNRIILIITDIQLPGKSGIDLIREVRRKNHVPFLVISGYKSRTFKTELEQLGVTDVLEKPFDIEQLVKKIKSII